MSLSSFIWSVADLLRGDYKQSEYGKVILPFTVLRMLPHAPAAKENSTATSPAFN
jgi:type I restriction-modification system DNA methylase subunit